MRVVSWNIEKNVDAWYHLADKLDPDFAFIQNSVALPEDIDGILIHAANTADENSVIYAKVGGAYRLRSTMALTDGGIVATFGNGSLDDVHLLDVNPWNSVTYDSARIMISELSRVTSFLSKKIPKRVIYAGHLNISESENDKVWTGFFRSLGKKHENSFQPLERFGLRDCSTKFAAPLLPASRCQLNHNNPSQPFFWATKEIYTKLRSINVYLDDEIISLSPHNPVVADYNR